MAALVRGMRVEDALLQLQVTVKRAAKTVYQVTLFNCSLHFDLTNVKFGSCLLFCVKMHTQGLL